MNWGFQNVICKINGLGHKAPDVSKGTKRRMYLSVPLLLGMASTLVLPSKFAWVMPTNLDHGDFLFRLQT